MAEVTSSLAAAALAVLRANDRGDRTVAAPRLYPHQWSWDAAFVAIGWGSLSVERALAELRHLLRGQWATGMLPHIVYTDEPGYFPDPARWRTSEAVSAPREVPTSGICQPAIHSLAIWLIAAQADANGGEDPALLETFLHETFDDWLRWHRWLDEVRSTHATGLMEIHHPWESGMDNSPRWDAPSAAVLPGEMAPYVRADTRHVKDTSERPGDDDYDRYLWLVEQLASVGYDDDRARATVDFRVGDVFSTAVHALSAGLLAELGDRVGRDREAAALRAIADRARAAVDATIDPATGLARDYDMRAEAWIASETIGGFAPLICGAAGADYDRLVQLLEGAGWCGHPALAHPLPPTTAPDAAEFASRTYWRGPTWPVVTWLISWALQHHGALEPARRIATAGLHQLADGTFAEYYDSLTGAPLGSHDQSWTAAAALAWEASERRP
ncbi:glucosylglycerate hydrolase [Pseudactinotalea sp.]|uniref:glucosylglycerate hydrolase n=1 Tax=Pseudactinotalea sp. TaxID=1926260 RepID=UPI003B3B7E13